MKTKLMPLIGAAVTIALGATAALAVDRRSGGRADDLVRLYAVPGMGHCSGGPATDQADFITPLVAWVDQGKAPRSVVATARGAGNAGGVNAELPAAWAANRTRPLCPYPSVALYKGSGDVESASSFECRATRRHHQHHDDEDD
jgi:Tannase and feruloyl esterase